MKGCQGQEAVHEIGMRVGLCWDLDLPRLLHVGVIGSNGKIGGGGVVVHELKVGRFKG